MCRYGQVSEDLCPIYSSSEKSKCLGIGSNNKDLDFGHIDLRVGHIMPFCRSASGSQSITTGWTTDLYYNGARGVLETENG